MDVSSRESVPILDADGTPLNALVDVEVDGETVALTLHSGSGSGSDYGRALDRILGKIAIADGSLKNLVVDPTTGPNAKLPEEHRRIAIGAIDGFDESGKPASGFDANGAGRSIRRAIGQIISPGKGGAGPNSRLRLVIQGVAVERLIGVDAGLRAGASVTKSINASDLGSASNQWGLHLPLSFAREAVPDMIGDNLPEAVRHREIDVVDEAGVTWSCAIKRPPSKPEFYLHGSREITSAWAISEGDTLRLEVVDSRTMSIAFDIEDPPAVPIEIAAKLKPEGAVRTRVARYYERNGSNRKACLARHGYDCTACGDNMEELYGERGRDYIHVHHVIRVADLAPEYELDIEKDLVPVCPNCHAMIHRREPMLPIGRVKELVSARPHSRQRAAIASTDPDRT